MKMKSYDDWQLLGYQVMKGQKAKARDPKTGKGLFSRDQVQEKTRFDEGDADRWTDFGSEFP